MDESCGKCKHFSPSRGPTGRVRPSEPGLCGWDHPAKDDITPVFDAWQRRYLTLGEVVGRGLRRTYVATPGCPCWEKGGNK